MGNTVKVKLIRTHIIGAPGQIIRAFGHDFVIQPNREAHCDMHVDFIPTETAAGRVEVIEAAPPKPEKIEEQETSQLTQFTIEISDFYGTGSIDKLRSELSKCRKEILQEFANTRLGVDLPDAQPNQKMIQQIIRLVSTAHQNYQAEKAKD